MPTEDWQMAKWIQAGARQAGFEEFIYGAHETPVQHLHQRLAEDLASL